MPVATPAPARSALGAPAFPSDLDLGLVKDFGATSASMTDVYGTVDRIAPKVATTPNTATCRRGELRVRLRDIPVGAPALRS
jgi:hypothetical protein